MSDMRRCIDHALDEIEKIMPELLHAELADLDYMPELTEAERVRSKAMREVMIRKFYVDRMFDEMLRQVTEGGDVVYISDMPAPADATLN